MKRMIEKQEEDLVQFLSTQGKAQVFQTQLLGQIFRSSGEANWLKEKGGLNWEATARFSVFLQLNKTEKSEEMWSLR